MRAKYCLFTNDVETTSIWFNSLSDETGLKVIREGMPALLDVYSKFGIKTTFFFVADFAEKHPEVVKMVISNGHEVGSHGYTHDNTKAFDVLDFKEQCDHLKKSKQVLEDICGQEVISFRAPALRVNKDTARALVKTGYKIDSSVASQRFDFFFSFGGINKLNWLTAPRMPYRTCNDNIFKKGKGSLIEVPISAFIFPYIGTTMRIFPFLTALQRRLLYCESVLNGKPVVFDIHPNEFIDESDEPRNIHRRANNVFSYILKDLLRSRLKVRNLGINAIRLYEKQLSFFYKKGFEFSTIKDYCIKNDLL